MTVYTYAVSAPICCLYTHLPHVNAPALLHTRMAPDAHPSSTCFHIYVPSSPQDPSPSSQLSPPFGYQLLSSFLSCYSDHPPILATNASHATVNQPIVIPLFAMPTTHAANEAAKRSVESVRRTWNDLDSRRRFVENIATYNDA